MGNLGERFQKFFDSFGQNWAGYLLQFILIAAVFYYVFKILKVNKGGKFIAVVTVAVIVSGLAFALTDTFSQELLFIVILMIALLIFTMFHTEIKRALLDSNVKKSKKQDSITVTGVERCLKRHFLWTKFAYRTKRLEYKCAYDFNKLSGKIDESINLGIQAVKCVLDKQLDPDIFVKEFLQK